MSSLVVEGRAQLLRNDLRRGTGRQQEEEMAVAVDDVDEARMREGVVIAVLGLDLLVDDFERFCGGRDRALRSCQADEAGMYRSTPFSKPVCRFSRRMHCDAGRLTHHRNR